MKSLPIKIVIFFLLGMTFSFHLAYLAHLKKYETLETVATILSFIFLIPLVLLSIFIILYLLYEKNNGNRMKIRQNETELKGKCILKNGKVIGDATYKRIEWLRGRHPKQVAASQQTGRMKTLYQDFTDRRYWRKFILTMNSKKEHH
jgi:hypothetical protein